MLRQTNLMAQRRRCLNHLVRQLAHMLCRQHGPQHVAQVHYHNQLRGGNERKLGMAQSMRQVARGAPLHLPHARPTGGLPSAGRPSPPLPCTHLCLVAQLALKVLQGEQGTSSRQHGLSTGAGARRRSSSRDQRAALQPCYSPSSKEPATSAHLHVNLLGVFCEAHVHTILAPRF